MAGVHIPSALLNWANSFVPDGATAEEKHEIITSKVGEKLVEYQVEYRVKLGLVDGSLSTPEGCTTESIMAKSDEHSTTAFDNHCITILDACISGDADL